MVLSSDKGGAPGGPARSSQNGAPGEGIAVVVALCVSDLIEKRGTRQDVTSLPRFSSESDVTTGVRDGIYPPERGDSRDAGFCTLHVDQSAQIYVDYEQDAPVARCRERRAVSPMAASASVDKALAGWRTRRRHTNRCNPHRVSLVGGRR